MPSEKSYVRWFDSVSRTDTQFEIAINAPVVEANHRASQGQTFSKGLIQRLRASSTLGVEGASSLLTVMSPLMAINDMGRSFHFESTAGEIDVMAAHLATTMLPPDKALDFLEDLGITFSV